MNLCGLLFLSVSLNTIWTLQVISIRAQAQTKSACRKCLQIQWRILVWFGLHKHLHNFTRQLITEAQKNHIPQSKHFRNSFVNFKPILREVHYKVKIGVVLGFSRYSKVFRIRIRRLLLSQIPACESKGQQLKCRLN